jgi:hypothetical protein
MIINSKKHDWGSIILTLGPYNDKNYETFCCQLAYNTQAI